MQKAKLSVLCAATFSCLSLMHWPASARDACKDPRRVVGGEDADIKQHPWQVALKTNKGELCGGAIIGPGWVLTAAHCFAGSAQPGDVRVKAGETEPQSVGAWAAVEKVILHEHYNANTNEHDLALVKLVGNQTTGRAIPLAEPQQTLRQCEVLEITGWGRTKEGGPAAGKLQKALVPYVDNATCNDPASYGGAVRSNMMCAGLREGGVDSCQGDSGGPLVLKGPKGSVLVGIVSWGDGCARKLKYGVYTRVQPYLEWIERAVASNTK